MRNTKLCVGAIVLSLSLAACGTSNPRGTATGAPDIGGQSTPASPSGATGPQTTPAPPVSVPTATAKREDGLGESTPQVRTEPDAGDEHGTRVPARFVVSAQSASPRTITVPPFLAVALSLRSGDGQAHEVILVTPKKLTVVAVPAHGSVHRRLGGLPRGTYGLRIDDTEIGRLRVASEVGP